MPIVENFILNLMGWQQSYFAFFVMIFKPSLLIQITNINQLCIDYFVNSAFVESLVLRGKKLNQLIFDSLI